MNNENTSTAIVFPFGNLPEYIDPNLPYTIFQLKLCVADIISSRVKARDIVRFGIIIGLPAVHTTLQGFIKQVLISQVRLPRCVVLQYLR